MQSQLFNFESRRDYLPWALILLFVIAVMIVLQFEGRSWWCAAGDQKPWAWDIWSRHNSQHLIDPYSFTHILHGVLEFWLIGLIFPRVPLMWRLLTAVMVEGGWEI